MPVNSRLRILHLTGDLSYSGDSQAISSLARLQSSWTDTFVVASKVSNTALAGDLANHGIEVIHRRWIPDQILGRSTIIIAYRHGGPNHQTRPELVRLQRAGARLVEFNIFSRPDPLTEGLWLGHLHPSRASLAQYGRRTGRHPGPEHAAVGHGVLECPHITEDERKDARNQLGIAQDSFACVRLMRPDLRKWAAEPVVAAHQESTTDRPIHLIFQEAPAQRVKWIQRKLQENVSLLSASTDRETIRRTLAASDCILNYSSIGETFGLSLAEGMAAGLPAVVNSTPDHDNAQLELVEHGVNGLIAATLGDTRRALKTLRDNPDLAREMGSCARESIYRTFHERLVEIRVRSHIRRWLEARDAEEARFIPVPDSYRDNYSFNEGWVSDLRHLEDSISSISTIDNHFVKTYYRSVLTMHGLWDAMSYLRCMDRERRAIVIRRRLRETSRHMLK